MVSISALRGYVLEEALARLLRDNGYRLLVAASDDPDALAAGPNGLLVRGRGTEHQVDALGELLVPTPFSLPVRLFVEAKFRSSRVGLPEVRNALGLISDVNEYFSTAMAGARKIPLRRHHYRYSLFSTSGFTRPAQDYALAQQISLIDLQGPAFANLLLRVSRTADEVLSLAAQSRVDVLPIGQVRASLRSSLETLPDGQEPPTGGGQLPQIALSAIADAFAGELRESLLLGFPEAPFVIVLRPDDNAAFRRYLGGHGSDIEIDLRFARRGRPTGDWVAVPADGRRGFALRFGIPASMESAILAVAPEEAATYAGELKTTLFASINLFIEGRAVRLRFQPRRGRFEATGGAGPDESVLRNELQAADLALDARTSSSDVDDVSVEPWPSPEAKPSHGSWNVLAAHELLGELDREGWAQADVLRAAAKSGRVSRQEVYSILGYPRERTLRGFPRPIHRITRGLKEKRLLSLDAPPALETVSGSGGSAAYFRMPDDLARVLRGQ